MWDGTFRKGVHRAQPQACLEVSSRKRKSHVYPALSLHSLATHFTPGLEAALPRSLQAMLSTHQQPSGRCQATHAVQASAGSLPSAPSFSSESDGTHGVWWEQEGKGADSWDSEDHH